MASAVCPGARAGSQLANPGENRDLCAQNASQDPEPGFPEKSGHGRTEQGAPLRPERQEKGAGRLAQDDKWGRIQNDGEKRGLPLRSG